MTGLIHHQNHENQLEKHVGCMSGFFNIFDRQQVLAAKHLPPSHDSVQSKTIKEHEKSVPAEPVARSSAANLKFFPTSTPPRSPLPVRVIEADVPIKSTWKFCKEMPRLSLDSRALVDSKESLCSREIFSLTNTDLERRSPSVIARLMGLEQLPSFESQSSPDSVSKPELRRSVSESRVSTNLFHSRFTDRDRLQTKQQNQSHKQSAKKNCATNSVINIIKYSSRSQKNEVSPLQRTYHPQRKNFFNSSDIFPEPKWKTVRKVDKQSKDLEALRNILEALQLKGLLHSINTNSHRNLVYDDDSIAVLMNHPQSPNRRFGNDYGRVNRTERGVFDRSGKSQVKARNERRKSIEPQKRYRETLESRRNSPNSSPKFAPKRSGSEHRSGKVSMSPRSKRSPDKIYSKQKVSRTVVAKDDSSSFSDSSSSTTSPFHTERLKPEEYKEEKSLLARCDKLVADMNIITESQASSNSVLPSPVSVLDSAFEKDESLSPSPVKKCTIEFKDHIGDQDDDIWTSIISPATSPEEEEFISSDSDFKYISKILQASKHHPLNSTTFSFLEKQQYLNRTDSSNSSKLHRKLIFDIVTEILNKNKHLPPWYTSLFKDSAYSINNICSKFQKIREPETAETSLDLICTLLKKDLNGNNGWGDHPVEKSEAVLYIERLIFKDLVSETIRDLADFGGKATVFKPRRKLVF